MAEPARPLSPVVPVVKVSIPISILVATFDQAGYLPQCLDSLLDQRFDAGAYEIVVVNDGSTDTTADVLAGYVAEHGARLHVAVHDHCRGLAAACNTGLERARGAWILRVDSDDWLEPDALALLTAAASEHPAAGIVIPDYWVVSGERVTRARPALDNLFTWQAGGPLLDRDAVIGAGGYRDLFWEEYDLYLRMLGRGVQAARLEAPVLFHRRHPQSMTAGRAARARGWDQLVEAWPLTTLEQYGSHRALGRFARTAAATARAAAAIGGRSA
ncbi:MAG: glycosyltransferase family 2 protein [Chloroflexi bacterium]|nr:glycosyltransferase family 2 protein [Chloroflexota bacterium]